MQNPKKRGNKYFKSGVLFLKIYILFHSYIQYKEVTIPLLYGNIAAKWWGPHNVQPIVALHGWQDNAGTFDTLIPLLPDHVGYLAVDFPGHGQSDRFPDGTLYGTLDYVYVLHQLVVKFKWSKVTVLGHSLGAIVGFLYAANFPDRCKAIIALDVLKVHTINAGYSAFFLGSFDELLLSDQRNQLGKDSVPPTFTYAEMVAKMRSPSPMLDISAEFAPYLLERGICRVSSTDGSEDRFYFSRDNRLKVFNVAMFSQEMCLQLASQITCPHLYIRAVTSPSIENLFNFNESLQVLSQNPLFEAVSVDGGHHVHLVDSQKVSGKISEFIWKYHESIETAVSPKL